MAHRIPNERLLDVFKFTDDIELRYFKEVSKKWMQFMSLIEALFNEVNNLPPFCRTMPVILSPVRM